MMNYKKLFIVFAAILVVGAVYFRGYIPTTRSDVENLYYYFTGENAAVAIPSDSPQRGGEESFKQTESDISASAQDVGVDVEKTSDPGKQELTVLPEIVNNAVPFTPQAPFANWDALHEEACEEASLVMAHYFLEGRKVVLSKEAEEDLQKLTKFINKEDVGVEELKKIAEGYYKHSGWEIISNPNVEDFKKELASGNVIIIPLAGREIGNPYYKQPGPLYHMLVVSGYNNNKGIFITQDPGTKRGKNYEYKYQTLLKAIHDWTGDKNKIKEGVVRVLVVIK